MNPPSLDWSLYRTARAARTDYNQHRDPVAKESSRHLLEFARFFRRELASFEAAPARDPADRFEKEHHAICVDPEDSKAI
jgi:hypothetical protein